ncbi:MAG: trypsin-like peptidase domain-containing protein [Halioglobus sp.]|nr:trypsin-like peptidase domain-containing protein [Halioglobus sp.]
MKVHLAFLRVSAMICLMIAPSAWSASLPDLIDKIRPGVVGVGTAYPPRQPNVKGERVVYLATGFVVGDGRHIVTNAHVTGLDLDSDNNQTLAVFTGRGVNATAHPAQVVREDKEHDLVLLEIQGSRLPALQLGNSDAVREGQDIAFTGFPLGMALGLYPVTHRGMVAAITPAAQPSADSDKLNSVKIARMRAGFDAFQLDATAYPGNSGSPVFELGSGRVIGVINSVLVKETKETMLARPSGITYAIPSRYIKPLLSGLETARP